MVMGGVIVFHFGLFRLPWVNHPRQQPALFESIVVRLPNEILPPEPLPRQNNVKDIEQRNSVETHPIVANLSDDPDPAQTHGADEQKTTTPLDWRAAKDAAIQLAVKTATAKPTIRSFGQSIQKPQPTSQPRTIFTEPAHRFGDLTETPEGDSIVWLSENCYQITNSDVSHFMAFATGAPDTTKTHVKCYRSIGKKPPNSHLFDDLKRETEATP